MKRAILTPALLAVVVVGLNACASHSDTQATQVDRRYMTGSLIPQNVQQNGQITSGSSNVRVLDEQKIQGSGQQNVGDVLRQQGVTP